MLVSSVNDTYEVGELNDVNITTPSKSSWHLSNLNATTKYKFYLRACTSKGCGKPISEESATSGEGRKYTRFPMLGFHVSALNRMHHAVHCKVAMTVTQISDLPFAPDHNTEFTRLVCKVHIDSIYGFLNSSN